MNAENRGVLSVFMNVVNPLPPQAYTKDTLVQAYAWLQGQGDHIKEMATTPDSLVSLYLKAKLQGEQALDRPSIQNFKKELKSLAGMMGEFEVIPPHANANSHASMRSRPQHITPPESSTPNVELRAPEALPAQQMDAKSRDMIQEVKAEFNLSTDSEALRLLISIGYAQARKLFKALP